MKIALITDQHFGARNSDQRFSNYFKEFYDNTFFPFLKEHNIDTVIDLGDTFDSRKYINYKSLLDSKQMWFDRLKDENIKLHSIIGNHTIFYKNTNQVNSMRLLFDKFDNMYIYPEAEEVEFDGLSILFMPWINSENLDYAINTINNTKAQVCFGHLELSGFELNTTTISTGYSKKLFNKFDIVYSGHYHRKSDDGQVFYLGCPYQITWNDYNCPKGFHVFDTETRELERIVNPYSIYEKIYYDDTKDMNLDLTRYKDKFIKVVVVNKKDLFAFDQFIDKLLNNVNTHDVKIIDNFDDTEVSDEAVENISDTLTLLDTYVTEMNIDINKDRLSGILKTLYTEAADIE